MPNSTQAIKTFISGPNCCQAIVQTYAPEHNLDVELASKLGLGFGGGIGLAKNLCGAVSGMVMALGLKYADKLEKFEFYDLVRKSLEDFEKEAGSLDCGTLTNSPYGEKPPPSHKQTCSKYIRMACDIIDNADISN